MLDAWALALLLAAAREPVLDACEGCEAIFEGMPAKLESEARIAPVGEPGEPLVLEGTVTTRDSLPAAGIVVYAYHTNARGLYPQGNGFRGHAGRHGKLRGWVRTDARGHYLFRTIRPAGYPDSDIPQHVHMHVLEPGRWTYWIDDAVFDDDPRLTRGAHPAPGRGGSGVGHPTRDERGVWHVRRDIVLGLGVPAAGR